MAWGDSPLDTIQDAVDAVRDTNPDLASRLLDQAAHDGGLALATAREILESNQQPRGTP